MKKRGNEEHIKAIVFDIGGVLFLPKYSVFLKPNHHKSTLGVHEYVAKKLKLSIDQYFDSIDSVYSKSIEGKISEKELLNSLSHALLYPKEELIELYTRAYSKKFKLNKELIKFAKKLKDQGFKLAILSDQWHLSKRALVPEFFYNLFHPVLISCDYGLRKPNPAFFKLLLRKIKLKPKQVVFIDNQPWNIEAAEKLGLVAIQYINNKQLFKQLSNILNVEIK